MSFNYSKNAVNADERRNHHWSINDFVPSLAIATCDFKHQIRTTIHLSTLAYPNLYLVTYSIGVLGVRGVLLCPHSPAFHLKSQATARQTSRLCSCNVPEWCGCFNYPKPSTHFDSPIDTQPRTGLFEGPADVSKGNWMRIPASWPPLASSCSLGRGSSHELRRLRNWRARSPNLIKMFPSTA